jgi:FOG: CheY-like receiver
MVNILIVEDESIVALDIKDKVERLGYNVLAVVSSGEKAIEEVKKVQPELVLMDIVLKGEIDGIETARQIREHFDIPIIYLTAHSDTQTLTRAKITGPFGYLVKPFVDSELRKAIEAVLNSQGDNSS